jgi:two-component system cell cycle sensor histidine kinase/response regulator CckA
MKKCSVLIVSDNADVLRSLRAILAPSNYVLLPVTASSAGAVAAVQRRTPDIVLISIALAGKESGHEIAQSISAAADVPIVYLVAKKEKQKFLRLQKTNPAGFILLPPVDLEVHTVIEMVIHKHKTERDLAQQRRWLDITLRSVGDGVITSDTQGRITFMNATAESMTGRSEKESAGKKLSSVLRISSLVPGAAVPDPVSAAIEAEAPFCFSDHLLLRSKKGTEYFIDCSAAPIISEGRKIDGVVVTFRDVTGRIRIQDAAHKNEERFRTLIEKSAEAVTIVDGNGIIQFTTSVTTRILGYVADDLLGTSAFDRVHPDDVDEVRRLFFRLRDSTGVAISTMFRYRHKNGVWMWIEATGTNLLHDPAINGIIINYRDIGYRKEAEEQLNLINKRLDLISRVTGEVIGTMPIQKQVTSMSEQVRTAFTVDAVIVRTLNGEQLELLACAGIQSDVLAESISSDVGIAERILSTRRAAAFKDLSQEFPLDFGVDSSPVQMKHNFISYAGAPMLIGHTVIGIIGIFSAEKGREFTKTDLEHLQIVANHFSVAVANYRLFREIREQNVEMTTHIEEQTRVERLLRISEERYRAFVEQSTEGIYRTAFDQPIPVSLPVDEQIRLMFERGYIAECNAVMATMYGFSGIDRAIGTKIKDLLISTDPSNIDYMKRFIANGYKFFDQESHERDSAGNAKYFLNNGIGIVENGMWWGVWGTQRDVTERKVMEERLKISEHTYRELINNVNEAIYIQDENGNFLDVNATAERFYGYSRDEFIGKNAEFLSLPGMNDMDAVKEKFEKAYRGEPQFFEFYGRRKDGTVFPKDVSLTSGDYFGRKVVIAVGRDISERKQGEHALRESEERYRTLVEYSPNAVAVHVNGIVQFVNQAAMKLVGAVSVNEIVGTNVINFVHPDSRPAALERISKVYGNEAVPAQEQRWVKMDGTPIDVEVVSIPFQFNGKIAAQIIARDITERKRAEEALRESELRFRSLFENAKDAVFIADTKTGVIIDANAEAEKMLKRSRREIIGMHQSQMHPPERVDEALSLFREQMLLLGEHAVEFEVVDSTGKHIPVEIKSSVIKLDEHRIVLQGIFRDITDRKIAEEALRRSEEKYRALFEGSKDGIYISTYYGKFIDVNPAMVELLGYDSKEEVFALDIQNSVYYRPSEREKFHDAIADHSYIKDLELMLRRKDGSIVNVLLTATVERSPDGTPLYYSGTIRDITERKRLEQQLIQAQKMESIGTLAGGIAHDFNNLLAMILGTAELIKHKTADNPTINSYIKRIIEASERGASISKQLLLFSRPEQAELQPVSFSAVVDQLREFLSHFLPKNIVIDYTPLRSTAVIMGDSGHLHQALVNLAINARDAMPEGGTLSLHVDVVSGDVVRTIFPDADGHRYATVVLRDTGIGIDQQVQRRIFEPFFSTKERGKGTGLGLSIVHGIVTLHRGHIHVESEPGKGTAFRIFFPLLDVAVPQAQTHHEESQSDRTVTILIVDDEEILREILCESLKDKGYNVLSASDGIEALQLYTQHKDRITLVITDLGMPMMNGEQLYIKMKEIDPGIRVIVSSGYLETSNKSALLRMGIKDVLTKPFKFDVIFDTIHRVLQSE